MLNKPRIEQWVAALRSGGYKQIRKEFRSEHGHCCLGVACELTRSGDRWPGVAVNGSYIAAMTDDYGLNYDQYIRCVQMNDEEGKSFAQIADYLEGLCCLSNIN